jgi:hypothetical protein
MYFFQKYQCFIHNSHDIILLLRNYLISPQSLMQQYCSWIGKTIRDHQRTGGVKNGWGSTTISCEGIATGELFLETFTQHIHITSNHISKWFSLQTENNIMQQSNGWW